MYAKEAEGLTANTLNNKRSYMRVLQVFIREKYSDLLPHDFTTTHAREFIHFMRNDYQLFRNNNYVKERYKTIGMSDGSVNTVIRGLRAMFRFLYDEQYLLGNPFDRVKLLKEPRDTVHALELYQVRRLLKEPDKRTYAGFRDHVLMLIAVDTGLRVGELINLRTDDIDFKSNTIHVRASHSKNGLMRFVPFSHKSSRQMRELFAEVEELGSPYLFTTIYGNQLDPSRVRQRMKKYAELAGLTDVKVSPHILRHTFAKYYLLNGGDLMTLQKLMGHSSLEMVRKYVQLTDRDLKTSHNKYSPLKDM